MNALSGDGVRVLQYVISPLVTFAVEHVKQPLMLSAGVYEFASVSWFIKH